MKKRIHVNQHNIKKNKKNENKELPIITCKTYKENIYGDEVEILGSSKIVYPEKLLSCGARVWIETDSEVKVYFKQKLVKHLK